MEFAENYKAPHIVECSNGKFSLPSRKQALDIRMAREDGLDQLLNLIGATALLHEFTYEKWWTREKYRACGGLDPSVRVPSALAWYFNYNGSYDTYYVRVVLAVRPVTPLNLNP